MAPSKRPVTYRAAWIVPVDRPPIAGGTVTVQDGRIAAVGVADGPVDHEFPDGIVIPGLVNAHVHLEFSHLCQPIGRPGITMPDWIRQVVARRGLQAELNVPAVAGIDGASVPANDRSAPCNNALQVAGLDDLVTPDRPRAKVDAIADGVRQSQSAAVTALGEISTTEFSRDEYRRLGLRGVAFRELLGYRRQRAQSQQDLARRTLDAVPAANSVVLGLSPHAPYTVRWALLEWIVAQTRTRQIPLAMHVAECPEELELLATGTGPLRECLEELDAWDEDNTARRPRVCDYLQLLSAAARALVVHGNYLEPADLDLLARHRTTLSLVYCPRTHAFFEHSPYPLGDALRRGVRVAIATDSRASNPDLNLLSDLRYAARIHPDVSPAEILRAGTLAAAESLGIDAQCGSLCVGKRATLAVVHTGRLSSNDPYVTLMTEDTPAQLMTP